MKRLLSMSMAIFVTALLSAPAMASVKAPTQEKEKGGQPTVSKVPKAQIETVNKRKEAKKQRDEKLKIRAKNAK